MASNTQPAAADRLVAGIIDNGKVSGQQLLVIGLCLLFNMVDGFDITAMAVVASAVGSELFLTADKLGWIFGFALAGMMAGAMFLAPVSDLVGRRRLIIVSVTLVGISVVLTAYATTLLEFIILRFISGVGAGAMLACQATLAAEYSPERYRSLSVALVTSGYPLGAMFTSVVAGLVMPEFGWRGMFWVGGIATLCMSLVAWLLIPESLKFLMERRPAGALQKANRILEKLDKPTLGSLPAVDLVPSNGERDSARTMLALLGPTHRRTTLMLWTTFFLCFAALYFLMSWIPKLVVDAGYSEQAGRDAFFLFNLGGVLGIHVMGLLATRFRLTNVIFVLLAAAAIGMAGVAFAPAGQNLLMALIFAIGLMQQGGFTGLYAAAAKAYPTAIRSTGVGWSIGLGRSGAVVGPAVAGYLIVFGFDLAANFIVFAVPMAIGGIAAYLLRID